MAQIADDNDDNDDDDNDDNDDDRAKPLMTMPGISFATVIAIISGAVGAGRFRAAEKFAAGRRWGRGGEG